MKDEERAGAGQRGDEIALQARELVEAVHKERGLGSPGSGFRRGRPECGGVVGEAFELPRHVGMEGPERLEQEATLGRGAVGGPGAEGLPA